MDGNSFAEQSHFASFNEEVTISEVSAIHKQNGDVSSYEITLSCPAINEYKVIRKKDTDELYQLSEKTLIMWEKKYSKYLRECHVNNQIRKVKELNYKLEKERIITEEILNHTLTINDTINFDSLKNNRTFKIQPENLFKDFYPPSYIKFDEFGKPIEIIYSQPPLKPTLKSLKTKASFFKKILFPNKIERELKQKLIEWHDEVKNNDMKNKEKKQIFERTFITYMDKKRIFEEKQKEFNNKVENLKQAYLEKNIKAVEKYCDLVLSNSEYPEWFPKKWVLQYNNESKILIVEYSLPDPDQLLSIESYQYDKKKDEIFTKTLSNSIMRQQYDDIVYKLCLRTIHELFEADTVNAIDTIGFNGIVTTLNKAKGIEESKFILSVLVNKDEFESINLARVVPKNTFKHLKGISATSLMDLAPIAPQITIDRNDKRFIHAVGIIQNLDEAVNLAAMHWEDFEHLIRELFEKEFVANGGEVKVTQASSDGGVDAIAFDPDPIRGGKIVIQAKRYTNIVGVSAVRDLYGTVMNEGATKGVLVTTSNYGKDSYEFAKNKPITLINGNNLLALLEKHGHKVRINLKEAKFAQK